MEYRFWSLITEGCYSEGHAIMVNRAEREYLGAGAPETVCEMNSSLSPEATTANQKLFCQASEMYRILSAIVDASECGDADWLESSLELGGMLIAKLDADPEHANTKLARDREIGETWPEVIV